MADVLSAADRLKIANTLDQDLTDLRRRLVLRDVAGARGRIAALTAGLGRLDALLATAAETAPEVK